MADTLFQQNLEYYLLSQGNLTLTNVSNSANLSRQTLSSIVHNRAQLHMSSAIKIAKAVNIDFAQMNDANFKNIKYLKNFDVAMGASEYLIIFIENIRRRLGAKSQLSLSADPGVTAAEISNILNLKITDPYLKTLEALANQCSFDDLQEALIRR